MDVGRPTVMTEEVIRKLEDGFLMDLTDREACLYANIAPSTLYLFCEEHPDFSERKELLKENVKMKAKMNITGGIHEGDKSLSQWYLERRDKAYNPKQGIDHTTDGKPLPILNAVFTNLSNAEDSKPKEEN